MAKTNSYPSSRVEKSRLGRLLVNRGYITEEQLQQALQQQRTTGVRLGEALVSRELLSEHDLERTLRHQQRYRYVAAFAALVVAPLQPALGYAAPTQGLQPETLSAEQYSQLNGMQLLTNSELRTVEARGTDELFERIGAVTAMAEGEQVADPMEGVKLATRALMPVINMLDADVTIGGVQYREGELPVRVLAEGQVQMQLPEQIERITIRDIRPQGSDGAFMGNIHISGVSFGPGSSLTVQSH